MAKRHEKLEEIRAKLGTRTTNDVPYRNARDLFEDGLETEIKTYGSRRDMLGKSTKDRACEWFEEGLSFALANTEEDPATIPLWWATSYRESCLVIMIAGLMYGRGVVVDEISMEVYKL